MINVKLLPPLSYISGKKEISVNIKEGSVRDLLESITRQDERVREALLDENQNYSSEYICLLNGKPINLSSDLERTVKEGDEIAILMPISGGTETEKICFFNSF